MSPRIRRPRAHLYHVLLASRGFRAAAALAVPALLAMGAGLGLVLRGNATGEPSGASAIDALLARAPQAVVYSQFGIERDSMWAANPADPQDRVQLGSAPHAASYGIFPSLSPDGSHVAYTALGAGSADSPDSSGGQLWLLDRKSGASRKLTDGIDLRSAPVWSPASDAVVVRRASANANELLRVDLSGASTTVASAGAGLYAIGYAQDGALYYASLSAAGTDLMRAPAAGAANAAEPVAHLSDSGARNWHLSPDGKQLAYLAAAPAGAAAAFVAQALDIDSRTAKTLLGDGAGAQFNPVWDASGSVTVGRVSGDQGGALRIAANGAGAAGSPLPSPASGFDVPLSWSPDGAWLIVRAFEGASPADPGPSHVVAMDASGERRPLSPQSDVELAGWLTAR
jgi:hypothetical protein